MAVDIQIVPVRSAHVRYIARNMRAADRAEVAAASGKSPVQALAFSIRHSALCRTALFDGVPAVMFGVGDLNILAGVGAPWVLGTDAIEAGAPGFLRRSREWRDQLLRRYSTLRNLVDVRNEVSIRWLGWLGFTIYGPITLRGHAFRLFELRRADV